VSEKKKEYCRHRKFELRRGEGRGSFLAKNCPTKPGGGGWKVGVCRGDCRNPGPMSKIKSCGSGGGLMTRGKRLKKGRRPRGSLWRGQARKNAENQKKERRELIAKDVTKSFQKLSILPTERGKKPHRDRPDTESG